MDGISETLTKVDGVRDLPIVEITRIQEALKPLGYIVHGFGQESCVDFTLSLRRDLGIRIVPWNDSPGSAGA
jgi:hypothetical protein